jgi:hypothetical protein
VTLVPKPQTGLLTAAATNSDSRGPTPAAELLLSGGSTGVHVFVSTLTKPVLGTRHSLPAHAATG